MSKNKKTSINGDPKDHLANERTFLAWIRTSIGIMAFGFVIEKFGLFIQKFALLAEKQSINTPLSLQRSSSIIGSLLIVLGTIICFLSYIDYKRVRIQIENDCYQPSTLLNKVIVLSIILIGAFLLFSALSYEGGV